MEVYTEIYSVVYCYTFHLVIRFKAISHLTNLTCVSLSMHILYI